MTPPKKRPAPPTPAQMAIAKGPAAQEPKKSISTSAEAPPPKVRNPLSRKRKKGERQTDSKLFVGVDGEGKGRNPHLYVLLCASDEFGRNKWYVENPNGLTTTQCLDFLLELPDSVQCFAFSFNYDLTKLLADVPSDKLYKLVRSDLRQRPPGSKVQSPFPVKWKDEKTGKTYILNLQGTKFTVGIDYRKKNGKVARRNRVIWDVFKFYQSKFVDALKVWSVGAADLEEISRMKDRRSVFDQETATAIREYCFSECKYLGQLARKLVIAHSEAGLELKSFYGAGSSASAMLDLMGIKEKRKEPPDPMKEAVSSAFFGGRFEHSVIGPVPGPIYSFDISSAYPYQCCFLPCLEHGTWTKTRKRSDMLKAKAALIQYQLGPVKKKLSWAPFPYRDSDGNITFPDQSGGGWVWRDEFLAGEKLFPYVKFKQAWVLNSDCKHLPFKSISGYYLNRLRLGKEGAGIAIKLGCNSCYGKLAQSVGGTPPFQSWIWAGMITSGCRAQILGMMALHKNLDNLLSIATDGIYTREDIQSPKPDDTGTSNASRSLKETEADKPHEYRESKEEKCSVCGTKREKHSSAGRKCDTCGKIGCEYAHKPLGGWERKVVDKGVFFARPGIYFPLSPTKEELKAVRARGIGRAAMYEAWSEMTNAYAEGRTEIHIENDSLQRFCGMKSQITGSRLSTDKPVFNRSSRYGEWIKRPIDLSLNPMPKREAEIVRTPDQEWGVLTLRRMDPKTLSAPYARATGVKTADAIMLKMAELEASEQPDGGDLVERDLIDDYYDDDYSGI